MRKKGFLFGMALVLILTGFSMTSRASELQESEESGQGEEQVQGEEEQTADQASASGWRVDGDTMIISGETIWDTYYLKAAMADVKHVRFENYVAGSYMEFFFSGMKQLESIDLRGLDTSRVTNMRYMFEGCSGLKTLDLSNFDTSKVLNMDSMFKGCSGLKTLDLSSFETSQMAGGSGMNSMFEGCSSLETLNLSSFNTSKITSIGSMFKGCSSLKALDVSSFDTSQLVGLGYTFSGCSSLASLDLSRFDTSKVTGMQNMFEGCSSLTTLDLSNFNTSQVRYMNNMFKGCSSLKTLNLSSFNTSQVTGRGMEYLFSGCSSLTSLDLRGFNTSQVTDMRYLFSGCSSLKSLDVSGFDTSQVTDMRNMFEGCSSLKTLDLSNFDASKVTYLGYLFSGCRSLNGSLALPGGLKSIGPYAFQDCIDLTELVIPRGVTEIGENAFFQCDSLINISIPDSVASIGLAAFDRCNGLTHVYFEGSKERWDSIFNSLYGTDFINLATIHYNSYYTSKNMPPAFKANVPVKVMTSSGSAPVQSNNQGEQTYSTWSKTVNSYLYDNGNGLTRVEYTGEKVVIENYDSSFRFRSGFVIEPELPEWGGFYAGEDYNFLIFGQINPGEDNSVEVVRVVKYDKDWNRLNHASLKGAYTRDPFDGGSLRCDEYGGILYVRTCHRMYTTSDGLNHQASLAFSVRQADMKITDYVIDMGYGGVGHSFNQFIMVDKDKNIVTLDQGDAYPRSAVLMRYSVKAGRNNFYSFAEDYDGVIEKVDLHVFPGDIGDNFTGASLGGLAETSSGYVAAYNFNSDLYNMQTQWRNIYICYVPKAGLSEEKLRTWTSASAMGQTPVLASTGLDGGYVLWENPNEAGAIQYVHYDGEGNVSQIYGCANVLLSDCQPVNYQGRMIWYTTQNSAPLFYALNAEGIRIYDPSGTQQPLPEQQDPVQVRNFVSRMYTVALGRDAEEAGLNDWTNRLLTHEIDGSGIANGFIMSDEFRNKNVSDETYVDILYRTFFDREADAGGRADWLGRLANGNSRAFVLAGFVNSVEFDTLCGQYGITRGEMRTNETAIGPGVRQFVERCYNKVLGRDGEQAGVEDWTGRIARGEQTPESVAKLFFFSEEYANKNTGNEEFVETLYQTFMDRASDPAGKSDWVGRLSGGTSREEVLEGFSRSEEFAGILRSFGL